MVEKAAEEGARRFIQSEGWRYLRHSDTYMKELDDIDNSALEAIQHGAVGSRFGVTVESEGRDQFLEISAADYKKHIAPSLKSKGA